MPDHNVEKIAAQLSNPKFQTVAAADGVDTIVGFHSRDQRSRAFNLLRVQVGRQVSEGKRVIGITSPTPQVGKTFVACNLAASLSRIPDQQTFIYDFDLRRGSVAERFGIQAAPSLSDYLTGQIDDVSDLAWQVENERLTIFPTFIQNLYSAEVISGARFSTLIAAMRHLSSDTVHICDLPPAFANDDAAIACEQLDGYLLVIEDGVTTSKQLSDAIRLLGPEKLLGTVLNRYVQGLTPGDYGFGYGNKRLYSKYYSN